MIQDLLRFEPCLTVCGITCVARLLKIALVAYDRKARRSMDLGSFSGFRQYSVTCSPSCTSTRTKFTACLVWSCFEHLSVSFLFVLRLSYGSLVRKVNCLSVGPGCPGAVVWKMVTCCDGHFLFWWRLVLCFGTGGNLH